MSIKLQGKVITFYGNPAGYVKDDKTTKGGLATVDKIFKNEELETWLKSSGYECTYKDEVFSQLALNRRYYEVEQEKLKSVRIWQLKKDVDANMKFISFEDTMKKFGAPSVEHYNVVFDGELRTNDLEEIYTICNIEHPEDYKGHSLSMSDVVELYDENGSDFHFCDRFGFKEIAFQGQEQAQDMRMETQSM